MPLATMTTKGQVTIPKSVREALRLTSGDKLEFVITDKGELLLRPITKKVDDVFGCLHRPGIKPSSVEDMNAGIRRKIRQSFEEKG